MTRPWSTVLERWAQVQRQKRALEVLFSRNDLVDFVAHNKEILVRGLRMSKKESARRAEAERFYDYSFVKEVDDSGFISALFGKTDRWNLSRRRGS